MGVFDVNGEAPAALGNVVICDSDRMQQDEGDVDDSNALVAEIGHEGNS